MRTIYKYPLAIADAQAIEMPPKSEPLCVQMQGGRPHLWCSVPVTQAQHVPVTVVTVGTGHPIPVKHGPLKYLGTYQDGPFVGHVFVRA